MFDEMSKIFNLRRIKIIKVRIRFMIVFDGTG